MWDLDLLTCGGGIPMCGSYSRLEGITVCEPLPCGGDITVQLPYTVINVFVERHYHVESHYRAGGDTYCAATVHGN